MSPSAPLMRPGLIVLFGSGETSLSGGRIFEHLAQQLNGQVQAALLETPAGFEPNSERVIGRVADFLRQRLQNYKPAITVVPARKRGTALSPDAPEVIQPLLTANLIFLGPGSPTYAARQLQDSRAWHTLCARQRQGAILAFASAATIAAGQNVLPVYEIYKAGEDLHWRTGLDFFGAYGFALTFVPHWNNAEGGAELDTQHCFMGQARFNKLMALLPTHSTIVGIDEHTALFMDLEKAECRVMGIGAVTILRAGERQVFATGQSFPLSILGTLHLPDAAHNLPPDIWAETLAAQMAPPAETTIPAEVMALLEERKTARAQKEWGRADELRQQIAALGWNVLDTREGMKAERR